MLSLSINTLGSVGGLLPSDFLSKPIIGARLAEGKPFRRPETPSLQQPCSLYKNFIALNAGKTENFAKYLTMYVVLTRGLNITCKWPIKILTTIFLS